MIRTQFFSRRELLRKTRIYRDVYLYLYLVYPNVMCLPVKIFEFRNNSECKWNCLPFEQNFYCYYYHICTFAGCIVSFYENTLRLPRISKYLRDNFMWKSTVSIEIILTFMNNLLLHSGIVLFKTARSNQFNLSIKYYDRALNIQPSLSIF